jgi:hypothetical protein
MKIITFILLLISFVSCSKKEIIHVSAINPVTGVPYAGLRFTITEEKTGTQEIFTKVYDSNLNNIGEALFEFKLKKNRSYKLNIETPANNCYKDPADITFAIQDESFDFKFELVPCAFLKLKINNANCLGADDIMNFQSKNSYSTFEGWSSDRIGCYSYESPTYFQTASGWKIYNWKVNRNGITNEFFDSIYLEENQYYTFSIEY